MSNHETENRPSTSVASEEIAEQISAVTDHFVQQLARPYEVIGKSGSELANKRHKETVSFKATSSSSGSGGPSNFDSVHQ